MAVTTEQNLCKAAVTWAKQNEEELQEQRVLEAQEVRFSGYVF